MNKGAARNMQRISLKIAVGTAPPQNPDVKQAPVYKQVRALELRRLARIRHVFEIEDEIAKKQAAGESVGLLREKLLGVRNGTIEPPHYRDIRPTGDTLSHRPVKSKTSRVERDKDVRGRVHRLYRSDREVISDLNDLRKGKLTPTGMATIKGLLDRFDEDTVIGALELKVEFVRKVAASALFTMVPAMSPADGLLMAAVLEARLPKLPDDDASAENAARPATPAAQQDGARASISVDAISGAEYMELRSKGWTISGGWMHPPGVDLSNATDSRGPAKKSVEPVRAKRARTAVAPATLPARLKKKGRKGKVAKAIQPPRHVPLSAEALARLRSNEAFRTSPTEAPRKSGTIAMPPKARAGFVAPPANTKITWRDESEDGSMWDR